MLVWSAFMCLVCSKYLVTGSSYYYRFDTALGFVLTKGLYMKTQICINSMQVFQRLCVDKGFSQSLLERWILRDCWSFIKSILPVCIIE